MNKKEPDIFEQTNPKRQEKTLREFKEVLQHLVFLLRSAVNADAAYLYWINRSRKQFVKEAQSTDIKNMRFEDRVAFKQHFLSEYKDISEPLVLKPEQDINLDSSKDGETNFEQMVLIPFVNNNETVALTALEWSDERNSEQTKVIQTYAVTLGKLLNTHLEITDLYKDQQEWEKYDETLEGLTRSGNPVALMDEMIQTLQGFLSEGSVSLIAKGMGTLCNMLNSKSAVNPLPVGLPVEENTLTAQALKNGTSEFSVHFNDSPKRISPREKDTEGASLVVPLTVNKLRVAAVLIHDKNALTFKESTKHKLKNIVRLTGLKIQSYLNNKTSDRRIFSNEFGALVPDIWERTVDTELNRLKKSRALYYTWAGFAKLTELTKIRTQLRIEDLKCLQKDMVRVLNPGNIGIAGLVGFHTEHQYFILIQSRNEEALNIWVENINQKFEQPFILSNELQVESGIQTEFVKLNRGMEDSYDVVQQCKKKLRKI